VERHDRDNPSKKSGLAAKVAITAAHSICFRMLQRTLPKWRNDSAIIQPMGEG
jgi:hypothetical protein